MFAIINNGELLQVGNPLESIAEIEGKVWRKRISKDEIDTYKANFDVISEQMISGSPEIHVLSDAAPDSTFEPVAADLEDVYFAQIIGSQKEAV